MHLVGFFFSFYLSDLSKSDGFNFNDTILLASNKEYINLQIYHVHCSLTYFLSLLPSVQQTWGLQVF